MRRWLGYSFGCKQVRAVTHAVSRAAFHSARPIRSRAFVAQEREVRKRWRQDRPAWNRAFWRVIDTDLSERLVVQPLASVLNLVRRSNGTGHPRARRQG